MARRGTARRLKETTRSDDYDDRVLEWLAGRIPCPDPYTEGQLCP
jgi:hypothetical protein